MEPLYGYIIYNAYASILIPSDVPFEFRRLQFPIRLPFAWPALRGMFKSRNGEEYCVRSSVPIEKRCQHVVYSIKFQIENERLYCTVKMRNRETWQCMPTWLKHASWKFKRITPHPQDNVVIEKSVSLI